MTMTSTCSPSTTAPCGRPRCVAVRVTHRQHGYATCVQIERLEAMRAERDGAAVEAALEALTRAAGAANASSAVTLVFIVVAAHPRAESGEGNLLALSVTAARARASVGEISLALERADGCVSLSTRRVVPPPPPSPQLGALPARGAYGQRRVQVGLCGHRRDGRCVVRTYTLRRRRYLEYK